VTRTRRDRPLTDDFWVTVDAWAGAVTEQSRSAAWRRGRATLRAVAGPYVDVTGDRRLALKAVGRGHRVWAARAPVGAEGGLTLRADPDVLNALLRAEIDHRQVTAARRYVWRGPLIGPVTLEISTTPDRARLEAWYVDIWFGHPKRLLTMGRSPGDDDRKPPRVLTAGAHINRLFKALGEQPAKISG